MIPPIPPPKSESLSLPEMLRIMDVATEMRLQRETVEKEFAVDETKRLLREKLLQTTTITGERVTDAEVDNAINSYFETLYSYREPTGSLSVTLASWYVRRGRLAVVATLMLLLAGTGWWMMHVTATRFSRTARSTRDAAKLGASINQYSERVRAIARDATVNKEVESWLREVQVARQQFDIPTLTSVNQRLAGLLGLLDESYEIQIASDPNRQSGFVRNFDDGQHAAYYVIVSAKNAKGESIRRPILNAETNQTETVDQWAEQIPQDVYQRISVDKASDGILGETLFAVKQRGFRDVEVRLANSDGKPIARQRQITAW